MRTPSWIVLLGWLALAGCTGTVAGGNADSGNSGGGAGGGSGGGGILTGGNGGGTVDAGPTDAGPGDSGVVFDDPDAGSPWGIASSASSSYNPQGWVPQIAAIGIHHLRGFDQGNAATSIAYDKSQGVASSGILIMSGDPNTFTFPSGDLSAWKTYVTNTVRASQADVNSWEVWNEPPNFTADTDPGHYGALVAAAYDAAKAVDPSVQIALCGKSAHIEWLDQAISQGAKDHFDYITLHPYETLGLIDRGFDAEFFAISAEVRKMLHARNPAKENVPIIFTELGEPVGNGITDEHQAATAVKAYVLSLAQGITRIHWFEGRDGDSGPFGFLDGNGNPRPSYGAMKTLIAQLGDLPRYRGWVLLDGKHYGFVFQASSGPVLVAWAQPGTTDTISWGQTVHQFDLAAATDEMTASTTLTPVPVLIAQAPAALLTEAIGHLHAPLPWKGDYSQATSVSLTAPDQENGLHPLSTGIPGTIDGTAVRDCSTSASQTFTVDPNFLSYDNVPIQITAVLKRNGADSAGFNLHYESLTGSSSTGSWYAIPDGQGFITQTWTITDARFVGMWGYNFSFDSDSTQNSNYSLVSVTVTKM